MICVLYSFIIYTMALPIPPKLIPILKYENKHLIKWFKKLLSSYDVFFYLPKINNAAKYVFVNLSFISKIDEKLYIKMQVY